MPILDNLLPYGIVVILSSVFGVALEVDMGDYQAILLCQPVLFQVVGVDQVTAEAGVMGQETKGIEAGFEAAVTHGTFLSWQKREKGEAGTYIKRSCIDGLRQTATNLIDDTSNPPGPCGDTDLSHAITGPLA